VLLQQHRILSSIKKKLVFPPLPSLIDSAIKHNAAVQYRRLEIEVRESNVTTQRNGWLRNLGVQGDSRYGTIDAFFYQCQWCVF